MWQARLYVVVAACLWGLAGPCVKMIDLSIVNMSAFRVGVPAILFFLWYTLRREDLWELWSKDLLIGSLINGTRLVLYIVAFTMTSVGKAVIIMYTWPISATLFAWWLLGEKVSIRSLFFLALSFLGVMVMYSEKGMLDFDADFWGMTAMLVSTTLGSAALVFFRRELKRVSSVKLIFFQNVTGAAIMIPFAICMAEPISSTQVLSASAYGLVFGALSFVLFFQSLTRLSIHSASMLCYVDVIVSFGFGITVLGEQITPHMVVGAVCIIGAAILSQLKKEMIESGE